MVFCILELVTTPTLDCRWCRSGWLTASFSMLDPQFLFTQQRLDPRQIAAHFAQPFQAFRLPGGKLKPQPENLFAQLALLQFELTRVELLKFFHSARHHSTPARAMNLVLMGSLCEATLMASFAVARSTPSNSNRMRPGSTTATQYSGAPLPLPMRVSAGFLVKGLSGKTRIHNFPPRLVKREMATRPA